MALPAKLVLLGPMGAGKSTIGKLLATNLDWPYFDNDEEMSKMSGLTATELSLLSVADLHLYESQYLKELCAKPAPFIAGAAASVVDYRANLELLKSVTPIYLRITLDQVLERAGGAGIGRTNIGSDLSDVLTERFTRRDPIYTSVAKLTVELSSEPEVDAAQILEFLARLV